VTPWPDGEAWCLVLSGGGAKGVYHIGAWRALRELGIPVKAFVGNSIGAIVAGFLAAGKDDELAQIGRAITVETLLDLPENPGNLAELWRYFVEKGGLDTGPLRRLLEEHIEEASVRASGFDLGVVTVNVSDLKPREVFLEDMEPGTLVDYLMASSAFPGFSMPRIGGKRYVDGGLWDNLPYEMARSRGWTRIILLDISGVGWNRRPDFTGGETVSIRNSIDMGGAFDFDRDFLDHFGQLGYLDTLRAFGRLGGRYAFLYPAPEEEARFDTTLEARGFRWDPAVLPSAQRHERRRKMALLDCAAAVLEVNRFTAWTYADLASELATRAATEEDLVAQSLSGTGPRPADPRRKPLLAVVAAAIRNQTLDAPPYRTLRLVREVATGRTRAMLERMLVALHPELPAAELYFELAKPL